MKKHIKHFTFAIFSLIALQSYGQGEKKEESSSNSTKAAVPYICDNGGFESGLTYYTFKNNLGNNIMSCDLSTQSIPSYIPPIGVNNFADHVTLVDNDLTVYGGYDPSLLALGVQIPRVYEGSLAIKLNDTINDAWLMQRNITAMSKIFIYNDSQITYNYSLISERVDNFNEWDRPRFIVRLYNSVNTIVAEQCLVVDESNPIFLTTGTNNYEDFLYTGWKCGSLTVDPKLVKLGDVLKLEFIITDDGKGHSYGTVYIDNICNVACYTCDYCININTDVLSGTDNQQAENCINADNTINAGVSASYHAGYEVLLHPGFEALYGSKDRFYIEGCSGEFDLRTAGLPQKNYNGEVDGTTNRINVYPNPTNGELNIITDNISINSISLTGPDGKKIHIDPKIDTATGNFRLDVNSASQGVYLLTVEKKNGEIITQKIIKN